MSHMLDSLDSFIRGHNRGSANSAEMTNRQIAENFPDVCVDAFAQGMLDALRNDRWRLEICLSSKLRQTHLFS